MGSESFSFPNTIYFTSVLFYIASCNTLNHLLHCFTDQSPRLLSSHPSQDRQSGDGHEIGVTRLLGQGPPQLPQSPGHTLPVISSAPDVERNSGGFSVAEILQAAERDGKELESNDIFIATMTDTLIRDQEEPSLMRQAAEISRFEPHHLPTKDSVLSGAQVPSSVGQQALNSLLGAKDGDNTHQPAEGEEESENEEDSAMSTSPEVGDLRVSLLYKVTLLHCATNKAILKLKCIICTLHRICTYILCMFVVNFLFRGCHLPTSSHRLCTAHTHIHLPSQYHTLPPSLILPHLHHPLLHLPTPRLAILRETGKKTREGKGVRREAIQRSVLPTTLLILKVHTQSSISKGENISDYLSHFFSDAVSMEEMEFGTRLDSGSFLAHLAADEEAVQEANKLMLVSL